MMKLLLKLEQTALQTPDRPAYIVGTQTVTYGELVSLAKRDGALLRREGTSPVIVCGHKEPAVVRAIVACLYAGRAYVPVDVCVPAERLQNIIRQTGASLVLAARPVCVPGVTVLSPDGLECFSDREPQPNGNRIAYMIFTSGSTGVPKGVPVSCENLENFVRWEQTLPCLNGLQAATVCNQARFHFDLSVADLYYALCGGHTLAAVRTENSLDFAEIFRVLKKSDVAVMTPTFLRLCLTERDFNTENYPKLSCVYVCGEPLPKPAAKTLLERFPRLCLLNAYGPTEATSAVCAVRITKEMLRDDAPLPVGELSAAATEIFIENGEVILKGKSVCGGYLHADGDAFFVRDGEQCYRTGDLGYTQNGMLYVSGRRDGQIKYMGYRIELGEIENAALRIPGVRACAVVPQTAPDGTVRAITAFAEADAFLSPDAVQTALRRTLPSYMVPKTVRILPSLPVTANGKTDRKELQKQCRT